MSYKADGTGKRKASRINQATSQASRQRRIERRLLHGSGRCWSWNNRQIRSGDGYEGADTDLLSNEVRPLALVVSRVSPKRSQHLFHSRPVPRLVRISVRLRVVEGLVLRLNSC